MSTELIPIFDWQARLYDRIDDVRDALQDARAALRVRWNGSAPHAGNPEELIPEPERPALGIRRHGRYLVLVRDGRGCWLAPWLLTALEVSWNMPKYTLTLLGAGVLMASGHWLNGEQITFAVLSTVCAYGALRCCIAMVQADWGAAWRDLRRGLRLRPVRPARRLKLGSKSIPVGRTGWAA